MIMPQKPYLLSMTTEVPKYDSTPSNIMDQIYPSTIPPIRFGIKNTASKIFEPRICLVIKYARKNAATFMMIILTRVNTAVNKNEFIKLLSEKALR